MRSLHNFVKLKAGVWRAARGLHPRLVVSRVKNENHHRQHQRQQQGQHHHQQAHVEKEKRSGAPPPRPSFVSSFSSPTGAAAVRHGSDTGLTKAEALSRVLATPSVHGPFIQSSQRLIDDRNPVRITHSPPKMPFFSCTRRTLHVLSKAGSKEEHSDEVLSPVQRREHSPGALSCVKEAVWHDFDKLPSQNKSGKDSRCALSSLKQAGWPERRWSGSRSEGRALAAEFSKSSIESREERIDLEDGGGTRNGTGLCCEDRGVFQEVELSGKAGGRNRGGRIFGSTGLQPSRSSSSVGFMIRRALHDVSLAGESRSSENEHERTSDQSGKDEKSLNLLSAACNLPHPDKAKTGGEDAYFICPERQVVGVADGVGGWADLGIDAGEYARELMSQSKIAVHKQSGGFVKPAQVLEIAHSMTKCKGSSTACILALSDSVLEAANLGDSGFVVMRNSRPIFKSPVQQHDFNIPFQLESGGSDPPSAAQVFSVPVSEGDVIIAGTDGLFDNLYDSEMTTLVVQAIRGHMAPQVTADKIANLARSRAKDKNRQTPFSTAAQDAGYRFYGGKMDDITVIVSYITNKKSGPK